MQSVTASINTDQNPKFRHASKVKEALKITIAVLAVIAAVGALLASVLFFPNAIPIVGIAVLGSVAYLGKSITSLYKTIRRERSKKPVQVPIINHQKVGMNRSMKIFSRVKTCELEY